MKRLFLALVLTMGMTVAHCAAQPPTPVPAPFVGSYIVDGVNQDGRQYKLGLKVVKAPDEQYLVEYLLEGETAAVGYGILSPDNTLSVVFQSVEGFVGLAVFVKGEHGIYGKWLLPGVEGLGGEILTPVDALPELPALPPVPSAPVQGVKV